MLSVLRHPQQHKNPSGTLAFANLAISPFTFHAGHHRSTWRSGCFLATGKSRNRQCNAQSSQGYQECPKNIGEPLQRESENLWLARSTEGWFFLFYMLSTTDNDFFSLHSILPWFAMPCVSCTKPVVSISSRTWVRRCMIVWWRLDPFLLKAYCRTGYSEH